MTSYLGKFNENAGNLNFKQCSNYCFARSVYIRGRDAKGTNVSLLNEDSQYSNYLSPTLRFNNYWSPRGIKKFENFASSLSNDQSYLQQVDNVVGKSWMMFKGSVVKITLKHGLKPGIFLRKRFGRFL